MLYQVSLQAGIMMVLLYNEIGKVISVWVLSGICSWWFDDGIDFVVDYKATRHGSYKELQSIDYESIA